MSAMNFRQTRADSSPLARQWPRIGSYRIWSHNRSIGSRSGSYPGRNTKSIPDSTALANIVRVLACSETKRR